MTGKHGVCGRCAIYRAPPPPPSDAMLLHSPTDAAAAIITSKFTSSAAMTLELLIADAMIIHIRNCDRISSTSSEKSTPLYSVNKS
jgi:hypothetical protein